MGRLLNQLALSNQSLTRHPDRLADAPQLAGLQQLQRLTHNRFRIFVVSDFAGDLEMWRTHLQRLARNNQVDLIHVYDPLTRNYPQQATTVTDGERRVNSSLAILE